MLFVDHLVFIVKDISRTEKFYTPLLGNPIEKTDDSVVYRVDDTKLFFGLPYTEYGSYNKDACGLNHIAFGVEDMPELEGYSRRLDESEAKHSGIRKCKQSGKDYIWFDDPDNLRVEFYLRGRDRSSASWEE